MIFSDNTIAEPIFGTSKTKRVGGSIYHTLDETINYLFKYLSLFYNRICHRIMSSEVFECALESI